MRSPTARRRTRRTRSHSTSTAPGGEPLLPIMGHDLPSTRLPRFGATITTITTITIATLASNASNAARRGPSRARAGAYTGGVAFTPPR